MRLVSFLLSLPWWSYLIVAAGLVWAGQAVKVMQDEYAAKLDAALAAPAPAPVALSPAVVYESGAVNEVRLRAQIDTEQTTELVTRTNGVVTKRRIMWALVPPEAVETPRLIRAFVLIAPDDEDVMFDHAMAHVVGFGALGPIVELPGVIDNYSSEADADHINDALNSRDLARAGDTIYLEPFLDGREAGLVALRDRALGQNTDFRIAAAVIAAFGLLKLVAKRIGGRPAPAAPPAPAGAAAPLRQTPAPAAEVSGAELAGMTPLERIRLCEAAAAQPAAAPAAPVVPQVKTGLFGRRTAASDNDPRSPIRSRSRRRRKADPFEKLAEEVARR